MFRNMKTIGIIPARGGSRRLPGKNILYVNGKPLIGWTIEAGCSSSTLDKVVVSTEDTDIARTAKSWEAIEVISRSKNLATDDATTYDVVLEALNTLKFRGEEFEYVAVLQPTSPLRTAKNIDDAFELMEEKGAAGAIGVCETEHPVEWMGKVPPDGFLDTFFCETELDRRSQEYVPSYQINGAIYIVPVARFLQEKTLFLKTGVVAYVMDRAASVDIDYEFDMQLAEWLLKKKEGKRTLV